MTLKELVKVAYIRLSSKAAVLLLNLYKALAERLASEVESHPHLRTTEFWSTVGIVLLATLLMAIQKANPHLMAVIIGVATNTYIVCRSLYKLYRNLGKAGYGTSEFKMLLANFAIGAVAWFGGDLDANTALLLVGVSVAVFNVGRGMSKAIRPATKTKFLVR